MHANEDLKHKISKKHCVIMFYGKFLYRHSFPVSAFSLWVQVHGLPKFFYNEEVVKFLGNKLGKFILYDRNSHSNDYGLRFKIYLSEKGIDCSNIDNFLLNFGDIGKISLILEQVSRFCPSCLSIGHVAQHCKAASPSHLRAKVSVVGIKSVNVKFDNFFGCYISYPQENGIKVDFGLNSQARKMKLENLEDGKISIKRSRISISSTRKRSNEHFSTLIDPKPKKAKVGSLQEMQMSPPVLKDSLFSSIENVHKFSLKRKMAIFLDDTPFLDRFINVSNFSNGCK